MEAIRELGLLELNPVGVKGTKVVPRDLVVAAMGPRLTKSGVFTPDECMPAKKYMSALGESYAALDRSFGPRYPTLTIEIPVVICRVLQPH